LTVVLAVLVAMVALPVPAERLAAPVPAPVMPVLRRTAVPVAPAATV